MPREKDGMTVERLRRRWSSMKRRCYNKSDESYKNYGARGISVCEDWHDFSNFLVWSIGSGYRDSLTIERVDNNRDYEPNNCIWIPFCQQARNRRTILYITAFGETKSLFKWLDDERCKIDRWNLCNRLQLGWNPETAMSMPKLPHGLHLKKVGVLVA